MATMMRCNVARASMRPARAAVVVRASAEQPRRVLVGLLAGAVAGAMLMVPLQAEAIRIPSQQFTGGLVTGGGNSPKSPSGASMESYSMEGTKKQGVSPKTKAKLMAKVRENAQKAASS